MAPRRVDLMCSKLVEYVLGKLNKLDLQSRFVSESMESAVSRVW